MPRVVPYWALSDTKLTKHHLLPENFPWACNACHVCSPLLTFGCETCGFNLHIRCALWLRTIRHRYDEHPYSLNYVPVKDHLAEYYCEVCCYKLNPKNWFYHCDECDQSIHCECIISLHDELSNIKFGGTIEADCHLHLVTFVQKETDDSSCQIIRSARVLLALNVPPIATDPNVSGGEILEFAADSFEIAIEIVKSLQSNKGPQPYSSNTTYKSYIKLVEKSSSSSTSKLQEPREKWQLHEILQSEKRHFLSAILHKPRLKSPIPKVRIPEAFGVPALAQNKYTQIPEFHKV
ncbi:hypothetical protein TEA_013671 [Camellia sinensis var. sinensis]|uniref:DC1 domain-containing protein n=1 Tax=Camellia sinensis var. sinensis TaxID=542762 RepID=A0A4S4DS74_CAMSN|nr:hypothetical protein TEA_013671 [Camellia sinensis var. sinensis]